MKSFSFFLTKMKSQILDLTYFHSRTITKMLKKEKRKNKDTEQKKKYIGMND